MPEREFIALGTAGERPNRYRCAGGYLLRWDGQGLLFDPGEGTQRQMALSDIGAGVITHIFLTHFHADHCLGVPGLLNRFVSDGVSRPIEIYYPAAGQAIFDSLLLAAGLESAPPFLVPRPLPLGPHAVQSSGICIQTEALDHTIETIGYRITGQAQSSGEGIQPDAVFAFVMDTRPCDAAVRLAREADLLVCESTFLDAQKRLAQAQFHLTATQSAQLAVDAVARRLLLTHFSFRYDEVNAFLHEARPVFPRADTARDCSRYAFPTHPASRGSRCDV